MRASTPTMGMGRSAVRPGRRDGATAPPGLQAGGRAGQLDLEPCAAAGCIGHLDRAAVAFDDPVRDREARGRFPRPTRRAPARSDRRRGPVLGRTPGPWSSTVSMAPPCPAARPASDPRPGRPVGGSRCRPGSWRAGAAGSGSPVSGTGTASSVDLDGRAPRRRHAPRRGPSRTTCSRSNSAPPQLHDAGVGAGEEEQVADERGEVFHLGPDVARARRPSSASRSSG